METARLKTTKEITNESKIVSFGWKAGDKAFGIIYYTINMAEEAEKGTIFEVKNRKDSTVDLYFIKDAEPYCLALKSWLKDIKEEPDYKSWEGKIVRCWGDAYDDTIKHYGIFLKHEPGDAYPFVVTLGLDKKTYQHAEPVVQLAIPEGPEPLFIPEKDEKEIREKYQKKAGTWVDWDHHARVHSIVETWNGVEINKRTGYLADYDSEVCASFPYKISGKKGGTVDDGYTHCRLVEEGTGG